MTTTEKHAGRSSAGVQLNAPAAVIVAPTGTPGPANEKVGTCTGSSESVDEAWNWYGASSGMVAFVTPPNVGAELTSLTVRLIGAVVSTASSAAVIAPTVNDHGDELCGASSGMVAFVTPPNVGAELTSLTANRPSCQTPSVTTTEKLCSPS